MITAGKRDIHRTMAGTLGVLLLVFAFVFSATPSQAQTFSPETPQGEVRVDIELLASLSRAQTLSLATLGLDSRGAGTRLFHLIIENTESTRLEQLYFHATVTASGTGVLARIDQRQGRPFSLNPLQTVVANNNDLQDGFPGVSEIITIDVDLTSSGEQFVNELEGSSTLPDRIYTVEVAIYQGNNKPNGGVRIGDAIASLPVEEIFTDFGFDLLAPGDVQGAPLERITSTRPVFRWEGAATQTYRFVVVEDFEGQSAQGLLQAALDTPPVIGGEHSGSLLEYEMADVLLSGVNFSYPVARVQPLEPGKRYFWQVFTRLTTPSGVEWYPSPIWQFGISHADSPVSELHEHVVDEISRFLPGRFQHLLLEGYTVDQIIIDGRMVSGPQILIEIQQFADDLERQAIRIVE